MFSIRSLILCIFEFDRWRRERRARETVRSVGPRIDRAKVRRKFERLADAGRDARGLKPLGHPVDTEGALFDLLRHRIELRRPVRTGPDAILAPDTEVLVDQNDAVRIPLGNRLRT